MAEQPPLNRIHVFGYSANDRDHPIVSLVADPRVAGYQVPKDLSACPDKRYPNHVFTGAQPIAGDQRVRHVWEILPSPWVPFTRYDDDLGPVQGRRRSVKNEGQVASLSADKRTTYEAREGSAIVYNEIEESWSIKTDEDGNSLFPIRDRDFYDPSRGPVQERRQLFVPTGEEEGSLENVNGVITQTSYEPYNEFLSVKIVQTYKVDGPQLIGKATNNEGQLVTVTTQRKAALDYVAPTPTATRTVEASREDAESLIERIVDAPQVFEGKTLSLNKPDVTPEKFRAAVPASSVETSVAGTVTDPITLAGNEISKSEQQVTEFIKRVRAVTRDPAAEGTLTGEVFTGELGGGTATVTEKYGANPQINPDYGTVAAEKEALGDGKFVTREVVLSNPPVLTGQEYDDQLDIVFPFTQQFVEPNTGVGDARTEVQPRDVHHSLKRNIDINQFRTAALNQHWAIADVVNVNLPDRLTGVDILKTVTRATGESNSVGSTGWTCRATGSSDITYSVRPTIINGYSGLVSATRFVFFLDKSNSTMSSVLSKLTSLYGASVIMWPVLKPEPVTITLNGGSLSQTKETELRVLFVGNEAQAGQGGASSSISHDTNLQTSIVNIPPTLHESIDFNKIINGGAGNEWYTYRLQAAFSAPSLPAGLDEANVDDVNVNVLLDSSEIAYYPESVEATTPASFPSGNYLVSLDSESFRYGLVRFTAVVAHITPSYV